MNFRETKSPIGFTYRLYQPVIYIIPTVHAFALPLKQLRPDERGARTFACRVISIIALSALVRRTKIISQWKTGGLIFPRDAGREEKKERERDTCA